MPRAAGLAATIQQRFGLAAELVRSSGGVFEIELDGHLLFSKKAERRFPGEGEVEERLEKRGVGEAKG